MDLLARLRFFRRKFQLGFRPGDLVLDVGSGNDPHPRADVLVDKFVTDDTEREGRLVVDRPLVGGDLERLPFRDGAFDFVIASHVLEHVTDPLKAVAELQRVARRGYVETPAEFGGKLMDLPGHRWYVRLEGEMLVFTGKSVPMFDDQLNHAAFTLWGQQDDTWMRFFRAHRELFFVEHRWEGELRARVIPPPGELVAEEAFIKGAEAAVAEKAADRSAKARLKDAIRDYYHSSLYGPRRPVDLARLCACPRCRAELDLAGADARCRGCGAAFPLVASGPFRVPMLLDAFAHENPLVSP